MRKRAPVCRNAFYKASELCLLIMITCSLVLLFLPILCLFLPSFYPSATPLTTLTASCRKWWFAFILCTVQWCSSSAPSLSTAVLIATMVEIRRKKNQNWQIFLDDVFTIILYIPTTRREVLKQQLRNETVPDLFFLIIPIMIFKVLNMEQAEPLENILEQHRTWTRERATWSMRKMMPQLKL